MHGSLGTLIWVVSIGAFVIAIIAVAATRKSWDEFGKDGLLLDSEAGRDPHEGSPAAIGERDNEIRQMLEARNARLARRGEAPVDVEAELGRLTAPSIDPELRREIRDLVEARNYRRTRAGKPPLDVEAEVEREIARLGELT